MADLGVGVEDPELLRRRAVDVPERGVVVAAGERLLEGVEIEDALDRRAGKRSGRRRGEAVAEPLRRRERGVRVRCRPRDSRATRGRRDVRARGPLPYSTISTKTPCARLAGIRKRSLPRSLKTGSARPVCDST